MMSGWGSQRSVVSGGREREVKKGVNGQKIGKVVNLFVLVSFHHLLAETQTTVGTRKWELGIIERIGFFPELGRFCIK